jgi:hypothetical protein
MSTPEGPYVRRSETTEVVAPQPLAAPEAAAAQRVTTRSAVRFAPDAVLSALAGLALLLVGLIAATRAGLDSPLSDPVVSVVGFTHTATLGLIEVAFGLSLLLSGAMRSRTGEIFVASVLGVAAFVAAVQTSSFAGSLAIESSFAWWVVLASVVVVLAALVLPRSARESTTVARY